MISKIFSRFRENIKLKKIESKQPLKLWSFVIILNIIGFGGFLILNIYNIGPGR